MSQRVYIGKNAIINLKEILRKHNPKRIFLVSGKYSYEKSGAKAVLDIILKNYNVVIFSDFEANPEISSVKKGLDIFRKNNCDFVIAVGGGSAMDTAKLINIFAANNEKPIEYLKKKKNIENKGNVFVAVPTTSGSGSEATKFAVVNIGKTKRSLESNFIIPDYAIVDPQFTKSLPRYQIASTGIDALSQAIESYWCIYSTNESKKYAAEAIKLIIENLSKTIHNTSEQAREKMARAAYLAGKAINISRTTANHAISYPITSYFNIAHGHAVGLTIPQMIIYNSKVTEKDLLDKRGIAYAKDKIKKIINLIGAKNVEEASKKITNLMREIGLKTRLSELGIGTKDKINIIIKNGFNPDRVKNNPRILTKNALREILEEIR